MQGNVRKCKEMQGNVRKVDMNKKKVIGIILSAGSGKRMNADLPKQYMEVKGKPILYYTLKAFEGSDVDEIIIAAADEYADYIREEIVEKYGFNKVSNIIIGGKERYNSVYNALKYTDGDSLVLIHDGARPLISSDVISNVIEETLLTGACVAAVPVKDTIKICENGIITSTPDRRKLYQIQTPQGFFTDKIKSAYEKMMESEDESVTDDAMVMEKYGDLKVNIVDSDYKNIKITTQEDIKIMEIFLEK